MLCKYTLYAHRCLLPIPGLVYIYTLSQLPLYFAGTSLAVAMLEGECKTSKSKLFLLPITMVGFCGKKQWKVVFGNNIQQVLCC